ncbi:MAG: tetraacyldisaccharide 4'-kinase [Parvularculaceae bacterium]
MMKEPWFWRARTPAARALAFSLTPASMLYNAGRRLKLAAARPERPAAPVVCIGNAALGGLGKTPFALMLAPMLRARGFSPAFLTRGYGGRAAGPLLVAPSVHGARDVGDEPLLLAAAAPTFVARHRPAGARAAAASGADIVIMDDGFQNHSIEKAFSILLIDPEQASARVFPAGPLREPLSAALRRADAVVSVVSDAAAPAFPPMADKPHFRAWLDAPGNGESARVLAFCGIGRPEKFFASLKRAGFEVVGEAAFADHHPYSAGDIESLRRRAAEHSATLITTAKDFVRLQPAQQTGVRVLSVTLRIDDPAGLTDFIVAAARRFRDAGRRHV